MESEDQRKTHNTSGHENHAVHVCRQCGWPFPNPHPSARHRRAHKRICGTIEGYKLVDSEGNKHSNLSDDEHLSDEDNKIHKTFNQKKPCGGTGLVSNRSEDDVFSDAAAEFLEGGSGAGSDERLANVREPVSDVENILKNESDIFQSSKNDPNADSRTEDSSRLLHVDKYGLTDDTSKYEIQKEASDENEKTNSIDDVGNVSLTSVGQETDVNGRKETDLDSNLLDDMISTSKIPEETTESVPKLEETIKKISEPVPALPADSVLQSQEEYGEGFHVKIPQSDLPLEVESIEHVKASDDSVETKLDTTEEVRFVNSGETTVESIEHVKASDDSVETKVDATEEVEFVNSGETTVEVPKSEETVKITSESLPADGALQSQEQHSEGFNVKIPQSDLPLDVESVERVNVLDDTIEIKLDATEEIKLMNSGGLIETYNRKEEGNVNVNVLSVPDDIHTVDHPEVMLEDFKDHNGVKLYQSTTLESSEPIKDKEDYVKNSVSEGNFLALGSTQLSGGDVVSSSDKHVLDDNMQSELGNGIPMIREMTHKEEVNLSQIKVKISESKKPDEIGVPADAVMAERDKNLHSALLKKKNFMLTEELKWMTGEIGKDDITRDGEHLKAETGDDSSGRLIEENLEGVHDAGNKGNGEIETDDETGVAGYDAAVHVKAENRFDKNGEPKEELEHPIISPESTSKISELQVNPESDLCEGDDAGNKGNGEIEKDDETGVAGYDAAVHVKAENRFDKNGEPKEEELEHPIITPESTSKISERQVNPESDLREGDDAGNKGSGKIEKDDETGVAGYDASVHVKAENRFDKNGEPKEEELEHPIITPESTSKISELQVSPESDLREGVDANVQDKGKIENQVGQSQMAANVQEKGKIEKCVEEQPQTAGSLLTQTVAEDVKDESLEKLPEMGSTDKGIASDSSKVGTDTVSGTQLVSDSQLGKIEHKLDGNEKAREVSGAALSDGGVDATPSQKVLEDHVAKEQHPSYLGAKSSVGDNRAREFSGGASGLGSQPLQEESEKKQLGPSAIDVSVDSSSQSDSLEGNWGSASVLSTQSDAQAIIDAEALPPTVSQGTREKVNSKQPKATSGGEHSDKSDMFEPPSFMTLVEPRGVSDEKTTDSEIQIMHNPQQSDQSSLQAGWFPSLTNVVNESQGRKKNEEIIAKVTNWSTGKQHTPLKNLLSEASQEQKAKSPTLKENQAPSGPVATTVNSILDPQSHTSKTASRETGKEWDSPARYHSDIKREKRKAKGRPSWVQFVCCSSVN
ncbi:hypothetical protein FNV43_RR01343 [Rhamnella rubrinervis]|uniref:C2H2-type domain-containing protein n=1 Tax=Rhamnella rubrinervis TaxID=2594499 RepID=A0A8K0HSD4_9ROSA|nr:hypothetical protein FNV43_RR01343 [Rhamnella rubrinervis]